MMRHSFKQYGPGQSPSLAPSEMPTPAGGCLPGWVGGLCGAVELCGGGMAWAIQLLCWLESWLSRLAGWLAVQRCSLLS